MCVSWQHVNNPLCACVRACVRACVCVSGRGIPAAGPLRVFESLLAPLCLGDHPDTLRFMQVCVCVCVKKGEGGREIVCTLTPCRSECFESCVCLSLPPALPPSLPLSLSLAPALALSIYLSIYLLFFLYTSPDPPLGRRRQRNQTPSPLGL